MATATKQWQSHREAAASQSGLQTFSLLLPAGLLSVVIELQQQSCGVLSFMFRGVFAYITRQVRAHVCNRNEFSAYLLLEKTTSSGAAATSASAAAAGGQPELSFNALDTPGSPAAAAHKHLISGVMHVDNGVGPDKWFSTGRDGTVKIWNGKVTWAESEPGAAPGLSTGLLAMAAHRASSSCPTTDCWACLASMDKQRP